MTRNNRKSRPWAAGLAVVALACSATDSKPKDPSGLPGVDKRDVEMKHEACDLSASGAITVDSNGDGRPEIVTVLSGGHPICRAIDFNMDGNVDVFIYFDGSGRQRRR